MGTDFICVEQIARYVIVIQRAFCITLTKNRKTVLVNLPSRLILKYDVNGGPAQPVEIYPLPHLRLTVPGRSDQQGRARLLPAPDESLRPNPGRRGQLQPDRQSHPHQF